MKKRLPILILLVLGIGAAVGWYFWKRTSPEPPPTLYGTVQSEEIEVGSKVGGRITEILVREGDQVVAGQPLVKFDMAELAALRAQAAATVGRAEAELSKLEHGARPEEIAQADAVVRQEAARRDAAVTGPRPQEIAQARADLSAARSELENAKLRFERADQLFTKGDISKQAHDDAVARRDSASARVESASQRVRLLEEGTRKEDLRAAEASVNRAREAARLVRIGPRAEDIAAARAAVREAKARVAQIDAQLAEGEIKAPTKCRVESVTVRPGDLVGPNAKIIRLLENEQVWVKVYAPEPLLGKLKVGQSVKIKVDAFPNRFFNGTIENIANQGEFTPRNIQSRDERSHQVFAVRVRIDNREGVFKSGMAAEAVLNDER
jgi:multidrug resistance efflux pump